MSILDNIPQGQTEDLLSREKTQERLDRHESLKREWEAKGDHKFAQFWARMAEYDRKLLEHIAEYDAFKWCQERGAKIDSTKSSIIVEIPGFDTIIADTIEQAVQLAIELEESLKQPVQQTIPNPSWLPSTAELDAAECELAARELEEGQQAYQEMAEDETRAIMAQPINGAYFL